MVIEYRRNTIVLENIHIRYFLMVLFQYFTILIYQEYKKKKIEMLSVTLYDFQDFPKPCIIVLICPK